MATLITQGNSSGQRRRCDATCHDAKHSTCTCICGGRYHGKGSGSEALAVAVVDFKQELLDAGVLPASLGECESVGDDMARKVRDRMASRLRRRQEPGVAILRAVARRLLVEWRALPMDHPDRVDLTSALLTVNVCISRCRSDLVA